MALARNMTGGGVSPGQAKAINGSVASGLTAAGTTQGTALALNAGHNDFSTVASGTGAILASCEISDEQTVYNGGANTLTIYPDVGSTINQLTANSGVSLAANTMMFFKRATSTKWRAMLSA